MEANVYFSHFSLDLEKWNQEGECQNILASLRGLLSQIQVSTYGKVIIPDRWHEVIISAKNIFEYIRDDIFKGDDQLFGAVLKQIYDETLRGCKNENITTIIASERISSGQPSGDNLGFFAALKYTTNWDNIPNEYHVSCESDLRKLAEQFMRDFPVDEESFTERAKKVFNNLEFHADVAVTMRTHGKVNSKAKYGAAAITGITGFSQSVVKALSALNQVTLAGKTTRQIQAEVSAISGFDCSPQGNGKSALDAKWVEMGVTDIDCQYHVKISKSNREGDNTFYQDRIYFGFKNDAAGKKIFVIHSGWHL